MSIVHCIGTHCLLLVDVNDLEEVFSSLAISSFFGTHCLLLVDVNDLEEVFSSLAVSSFFGTHSCSCLTKVICLL